MSDLIVLTPKLHARDHQGWRDFIFWCPACKCAHSVPTPRWGFNGNVQAPSFTPSVNITAPPSDYHCHFFVTDGRIHYCDDCNHALKGQVVDMEPIPGNYAT